MSKALFAIELTMGEEIPPLRPPKPELHPSFWEQHGWQIALLLVLSLVAVTIWLRWVKKTQPAITLPPDVVARSALQAVQGREEDATLVGEVSRILRRYVIAALRLPPDELTTSELERTLQDGGLSGELSSGIIDFLRRCDEWKFGPVRAAGGLGALAGALELIDKVEAGRRQTAQASQASQVHA